VTTVADQGSRPALSRTATGLEVPPAHERARPHGRLEDPFVSWSAALGLTVLAFFLRVWKLGTPREFEFDETYYAKDAWSMLNHGYVREYVGGADDLILKGTTTGIWKDSASMIVHPEAGKWLIALGEKAFGMDPFGWRIASAVVGSLMVLVMCRLARRMTGSTLLGCVAGLLLAFDGMQFVLSRLALLDIFVAFFVLAGVSCLVCDRDWHRARMAARLPGPVVGRGGGCCSGRGWSRPACGSGWRAGRSGWRRTRWRPSASWCGPGAGARAARSGCAGRC
jgi:dolichyl-phosphate-mannose-protein mannosyltransferase